MSENSVMREVQQSLLNSLNELEGAETTEEFDNAARKARVKMGLAKSLVEIEGIKVQQAKVLLQAGLVTEINGLAFQKEDKDAHPRIVGKKQ